MFYKLFQKNNFCFRSLLFISGIIFSINSFATHIIGGTLTYDHLGGSTYRISQRLYRDCAPNNAAFPASVTITVTNSAGGLLNSINIPFPGSTPVTTNYVCVTNPNICMEEANYTTVVNNLPPRVGGYHLYFQYCCRSASILNIQNPLSTGDSWNTDIPDDNIWLQNSSPQWTSQPTVFVCVNQPLVLSFSAVDADGDSLVHSWYTPYSDPAPTFPGNIATFTPMNWVPGYGVNNPCGGPNWTINSTTGVVTGTPPTIGIYIIGVKVEEYRNHIKIGEIVRDYNFSVVNCGSPPVADFTTNDPVCIGQTSNFINTSTNDSTYFWDFGVSNSTNDTSSVLNPNYLYSSVGNYIVTLIINPGQTYCTDTATDTVHVQICTNVPEKENASLTLSPNPAHEHLNLFMNHLPGDHFEVDIEDLTGKIILSKAGAVSGSEMTETIFISDLSPGIYFVKVKSQNNLLVKKLLIN